MTAQSAGPGDAELIERALRGGERQVRESAYQALLERYWRVVVVLLRSRVPTMADAEDLAQEAFVRAWRALARLEDPNRFLGWLLRIARNLATDHMRRRRPESSLDAELASDRSSAIRASEDGTEVSNRLEVREEVERVLEALDELPDAYRTVVTLRYLEDVPNQEMARRLGEPEGTIRNRLFRALRKLRTLLEKRTTPKP